MFYIPISLREQFLEQLAALSQRLAKLAAHVRSSLAWLVGQTIGEAAEAAVRALLGQRESTPPEPIYRPPGWGDDSDEYHDPPYRPWNQLDAEPDRPWWQDADEPEPRPRSTPIWLQRVRQGVQDSVAWFRQQPTQRPWLTVITLSGGVGLLALLAGPLLAGVAAGLGVSLASAAVGDAVRTAVAWVLGVHH